MLIKNLNFFIFHLIILTLSLHSFANENSKKILNIVTFDYPPYMFKNKVGHLQGLEIDLFELFLSKKNYSFSYSFYPIKRAISKMSAKNSSSDLIYIGTSKHFIKELNKGDFDKLDFGESWFVPYVLAENKHIIENRSNLSYLKNKKIAALRGSSIVPFLKANNFEVVEATTFENFFKLLLMKRVDYAIVLETAGDYYLKAVSPFLQDGISKIEHHIYSIPLSVVINKKHSDYKSIIFDLNSGRIDAIKSGEISKILRENYYFKDIPSAFLNLN